jgi:uncharacterized protein YndB with AHSA1/START domain
VAVALSIVLLAAILAAVSGAPSAIAGENTGLCTPDHSRFVIPGDFVLPACFDGSHLIIHNDTDFPLNIAMSGDVGAPSLQAGGDLAASIVEQYSVNDGDLMPDYRMSVPIGSGAATVTVQGSTSGRTYLLVRALLGVLPLDVVQAFSTAQALVGELNNDWQKYQNCRNSPPGFFGSLGCDAIYYRDVAFALGRAGVQFGASAVVGAILNLLQTAQWADAMPGEFEGLRSGDRTLDIPAATDTAPVATQPAANPSAQPTQAAGPGTGTPLTFGITGSCTINGGTLTGTSSGFTPGGTYYVRAWYPDGSEYTNITHSATVRADGTVVWTWPCAGDPQGTYTTQVTDEATGRTTPVVQFTIGAGTPAPTTAPPAGTVTEQEGSHGANTFQDVANASGEGPKIPAMAYVQVTCKVLPPSTIASAYPDGYWYLIASPPWDNQYYAVANTFWNGDVPGQLPYTHNEDSNVPDC